MIRTACIAATLLAGTVFGAQGAGATVTINSRISQIVYALHTGSSFSRSNFSFAIDQGGTSSTLFTGIEGVRAFNDFSTLNDWVDQRSGSAVFHGGGYSFTHSVLGSYFGTPPVVTPMAEAMLFAPATLAVPLNAPVPEPATWAMMIGGFALAGAMLRRRAVDFARA